MIRVAMGVPEEYARRAEYVFGVFAQQWGIPVSVVHDPAASDVDVRYGTPEPPSAADENGAVHIPFDERLYDPTEPCAALQQDGRQVWSARHTEAGAADLVAGSYRLLTFLDERQVAPDARDGRGVFVTPHLPPARRLVAQVPLVDQHAALLLERIQRTRPGHTTAALPKWPGGKRYAVAVTHDTDAVSLGAPRELLTNVAKLAMRRQRTYGDMVVAGLRHLGDPTGNPLFGFPIWRDYAVAQQLRSSFYLYAKVARLKPDVNNCKSSVVEQRIDWNVLRRMAADGFEFGLHAPINAKDSIDALAGGKSWIEDKLRVPIHGVRHHYWALDWSAPHKTWRRHVNSGYRYDTSIAWRDIGGFRAGTCHPFRPFDPDRSKPLDIYELPTCLMDGHVVGQHGDLASDVAAGLETIARVREHGGLAVLDWHTESACDEYEYANTKTTLARILEPLLDDGYAWFATPWEIVQHWHQRQSALEVAAL